MKGIDLSRIPAKGLTLALARWSNAFGGSGRGSRKGVERGRLARKDGEVRCTWEASFDEFGPNRFRMESTLFGTRALKTRGTDWRDEVRSARAMGKPAGRSWMFGVSDATGNDTIDTPVSAAALPTAFQRFLPLLMQRKDDATVSFTSLPEDAFPWWRPRSKASFFPLDASPGIKRIRCTGTGELKRGREALSGWTFEQHGDEGEAERWWLVSDDGNLLAMAFKRTLWLPEDSKVVTSQLAEKT